MKKHNLPTLRMKLLHEFSLTKYEETQPTHSQDEVIVWVLID